MSDTKEARDGDPIQNVDWLHFGKDGVIAENDPEEQEKRLKYGV
jgi:hypothetical protein